MPTLSEQAYEAIKTDIIRGVLEPDHQVTQSMLVDMYDFGLAPIREALQRLAQEGFVRPIPRYGYFISPITISDVHEIFELRLPLEMTAARLAALRASQSQLNSIAEDARHTYVYGQVESYSEFLRHNTAFHLSIAEASGNQRLAAVVSRLLDEATQIFHLALDLQDGTQETLREHSELAQALLDRDPDRAERLVREQIERSQEVVLAAIIHRQRIDPSSRLTRAIQVQ
jgi:DNA-binding GntR family transcriptional regulator